MKNYLPKLLGLAMVTLLSGFLVTSVSAVGTLTTIKVTLLNPTEHTPSTTHTVQFTTDTSEDLAVVEFLYCKAASGACTTPTNLDTDGATRGTLNAAFTENVDWTLDATVQGNPKLKHTAANGGMEPIAADVLLSVGMQNIGNNSIDGTANDCLNDAEQSSDTCYLRLTTRDDTNVIVDIGAGSYTVVNAITVTATVDPSFTFLISSVANAQVNNGITTSVSSTYNTLPFGNLAVNTPKYAAHRLNVTTNTQGGYEVKMRMNAPMTGVYPANNIDPFAAVGAAWDNPVAWGNPSGNVPSADTGWIGANTTDTDVSNWESASELFGPVNATDNLVMEKATADDGTYAVYVTYAIQANVFQPADMYTGTVLYTALPTY